MTTKNIGMVWGYNEQNDPNQALIPADVISVKVRGVKISTGRRLLFPRKYVVQTDEQAISLAEQEGIKATRIYGHRETRLALDTRLASLWKDGLGRTGTTEYLGNLAQPEQGLFIQHNI